MTLLIFHKCKLCTYTRALTCICEVLIELYSRHYRVLIIFLHNPNLGLFENAFLKLILGRKYLEITKTYGIYIHTIPLAGSGKYLQN